MKKYSHLSIVIAFVLTTLVTSGCSGVRRIDVSTTPIHIRDVDRLAESYGKRIQTEGLLIQFDKGDAIPVEITSSFPFASLESGENRLVFSQTTFVYLCKRGAYVSPDARNFAPVYDGRAIKKLYPVKTGTFAIGFAMTREDGAKMKVDVSLK
jgi:hypothetical protein